MLTTHNNTAVPCVMQRTTSTVANATKRTTVPPIARKPIGKNIKRTIGDTWLLGKFNRKHEGINREHVERKERLTRNI
jgi:hypothetical protein